MQWDGEVVSLIRVVRLEDPDQSDDERPDLLVEQE
jgi:hypothetical protein